ncbi:DUF2027 domain-containing protein [Ancylomarina euxinus]|uniref:DUF2027 domain-containing protein n=1 Tax=Ancylomarina euxinus TaxID=2283627 RepID=A0A425XX82_9BACT|nr:DUF2027 domain-containing protein [Ancylomarina euxinus]MCZ4696145.1 DUF2027 domain-containing protein [Ancylomarina euxinus]MUP16554.1 DUF2027 domain-containing protein [Ancylomarina euxinus]RRG19260.1 DUF2027 domain-containing protein [Ancylomarina euxinus]
MQINIGDKVKFLSETGGGRVTRIIDAKTVMVLNDEDDFEIPTLKKDLVVIESQSEGNSSASHSLSSNKKVTTSAKSEPLKVQKEDVYFAFVPRAGYEITSSPLELYLINDTNSILLYSFFNQNAGKFEGITTGNIDPNSKILLTEFDQNDLGKLSAFHFQVLYYQSGDFTPKTPINKTVKIQAVKFYKSNSYHLTDYFHEQVILHQLTADSIEHKLDELSQKDFNKLIREKESTETKIQVPKLNPKTDILEVDLHINKLIDSVTGFSNADILNFQMDKFHEVLRENENNKGKKIVFIHGIGNGTLKQKVLSELKRKYKKHNSQDASFKEYGYGATMVTIK